jgi:hypothetical protein
MSEVQTGMTTITRSVSVEDLRRAEAERHAAELADRMQREEAVRQRALGEARDTTAQAHAELGSLQQQLDTAKKRLPDLTYSFGTFPEMPRGGEVYQWQQHAASVTALVRGWRDELASATAAAEEVLRRRVRTKKAWQENASLLAGHRAHLEQLEALKQLLPDVTSASLLAPVVPVQGAAYEEIEAANTGLAWALDKIAVEIRRFTGIGRSNEQLARQIQQVTVPFEMVTGEDRAAAWRAAVRSKELEAFESALAARLASSRWNEAELPQDLALSLARIRTGLATAENSDLFGRLLQRSELRTRIGDAQAMLDAPPAYLPSGLACEWHATAAQLERVCFGHDPLSTTLTRRYQALVEASQLALNHAYVFAQAKAAIAECGLMVEEDVIDLQFGDSEAPPSVMAFTVPGFHDRKVVLSMDSTGKTVSLPLRFNDSDAEWERARDLEFDHEVCRRLGRALSSLATSGINVALTKEATAHPVLKASEVGFKLREVSHPATDKRFAREV